MQKQGEAAIQNRSTAPKEEEKASKGHYDKVDPLGHHDDRIESPHLGPVSALLLACFFEFAFDIGTQLVEGADFVAAIERLVVW